MTKKRERSKYWDAAYNKELRNGFTRDEWIHALSLHWSEAPGYHLFLRNEAIINLKKKFSKPALSENPISSETELVIVGKPTFKLTDIKNRLKNAGVKMSNRVSASTTHVMLATNPKTTKNLEHHEVTFISEQDLMAFLDKTEKPWIVEAEKQNDLDIERINDLILSLDESNIKIALEMLSSGGVPKSFFEIVFIAYKCASEKSTIAKAKELLWNRIPIDDRGYLKGKSRLFSPRMDDKELDKRIDQETRYSSFDGVKIARFFHEKYGLGITYLFKHLNKNDQEILLKQYLKGDSFDFSGTNISKLPEICFDHVKTIKHINVSNCRFENIPISILKFKHLVSLNMEHNYIKAIPKRFLKIPSLKSLNISNNIFWDFPKEIDQMVQLEKLILTPLHFNRKAKLDDYLPHLPQLSKTCEIK
ncbi:MAG: hypothetical protein MRY83_19755 [Flavobacteriales bacterium]|nr:hypothetical protein [Flavobacteriales bacterium]